MVLTVKTGRTIPSGACNGERPIFLLLLINEDFKLIDNTTAGFMHYIPDKKEQARSGKDKNNISQGCFLFYDKPLCRFQ